MLENDDDVGVAMALVIGAGAATCIGASVVFFPTLVRFANNKTLAGALGLSAGVMTYVSFAEIFIKSKDSFEESGFDEDQSNLYATLCFFAGVVTMVALNQVVTRLLGGHHHHYPGTTQRNTTNSKDESLQDDSESEAVPPILCHDEDPKETLHKVRDMAHSMAEHPDRPHPHGRSHPVEYGEDMVTTDNMPQSSEEQDTSNMIDQIHDEEEDVSEGGKENQEGQEPQDDNERNRKLMLMSLNTALAIGLHNFPEGLATFVAALDDPKVGAVLAMAIAIHNVPEGLCVAMPIYYATGNKWKAFGWACLSGVAEPIAGLLGWLILAQSFSDQLYALLFGMVAGMMVIISARELLPTAHRYDPEDSVVTYSFIGGMAIMALSLMLFLL